LSRVKLTIRLSSDRSVKSDSIPGSEEDHTSSEEEDDEDEYRITRTHPKRLTRAKPGTLPFSPRKTRARQLLPIRDSDGSTDVDSDDLPLPVRRSMRGRKMTEIELDSDSDYDIQKDVPSRRIKLLGPKNKLSRPRSVIPSLGRVRDISTVDEDPFDNDDEKEVLRLHRSVCEKCHEGPAHTLLTSLKKKSKRKGKKRKRGTDDEFEWSDDAEKLTSLGGWVQWFAFF
jgi:chromodomain-helicase-DNA-binding protein 4